MAICGLNMKPLVVSFFWCVLGTALGWVLQFYLIYPKPHRSALF
ncbi:hypothetical protein FRUB_07300 [Fimbriiglobus ruber]|uniref:Uncharacterized protein n=1 Tax=Fimbriiglobus ruber TaxID=1908690 RepID=A0A225D9A0_9BACT|nr:hypothetical protein FRUB_07300 [Fimbriiglobus ruber]